MPGSMDEEKQGMEKDGVRIDHSTLQKCTASQAAFNVFFYMFGATQVPYAMGQMGWTYGPIALATLSIGSWISGHLLVDICVRKKLHTWPLVAEEAFGSNGYILMQILQTVSFMLTGIVQVQGSGSLWQQAFPNSSLCQWQWIIINIIPYAIFLQIPSFSGDFLMKAATAITLVLTAWRLSIMTYYLSAFGSYCNVCYNHQTPTSIMSAAANLVFSYGSHAVMPEEVREMRTDTDMFRSWNWANAVALPIYAVVGMWGFWAFGVFNSGANMILNFKDGPAVRAYLISSAMLGYLPLTYGQILLFLKVELRLGVSPSDYLRHSNPERCAYDWIKSVPPALFRFVFRLSVLSSYALVAEAFLGFGLQNMVSLVGAISVTALTFYLPFVLHFKLFEWDMWNKDAMEDSDNVNNSYSSLPLASEEKANKNHEESGTEIFGDEISENRMESGALSTLSTAKGRCILSCLNGGGNGRRFVRIIGYILGATLGIFLCGAGVYFTIKNIMEQENGTGLFDGACFENSFFIGSDRRQPGQGGYSCGGEDDPDSFYNTFYVPTCVEGKIQCSQYGAC